MAKTIKGNAFSPRARKRGARQVLAAYGRVGGRGACPECERSDITLSKDGTLRVHSSKPGWPPSNCDGSGQKPKEG